MTQNLAQYRTKVDQALARYQATRSRVSTERDALEALSARHQNLTEAQALAQSVAAQIQSQAHKRIAEIVTSCLAIFEEPYQFKILFKRARGKTEAHLLFERDGETVDPLTASGGGVVDVAAFALRLACLILRRPPLRRVLLLDEPMRHLSDDYRPRVAKMIGKLSKDLGVQIIMVTHDSRLKIGKVVTLE